MKSTEMFAVQCENNKKQIHLVGNPELLNGTLRGIYRYQVA